ncbi:MAG: TldD/PmbA family protein [Asgard group archaeon]|nr:TldD/PmbA family protein [Asgard group archaeon]
MFDNILDICHEVIRNSTNKGVESIEIFLSYSNNKQVMVNGQSLGTQRSNEESGAGIRVIQNESQGFSYTNDLTKDSIQKAADEAFSIAKLAPKVEGNSLPQIKKVKPIESTYNKSLANLPIEKLIDDALSFIDGYASDTRINSMLSSLALSISGRAIINSNGLETQDKSSNYQGTFMLAANEDGKSGSYVFDYFFNRSSDVDTKVIGQKLAKKAIDSLNQKTITAFDGPVIFRADAMFNPILIVAALASSADWRQMGRSFWKDKLADKVTSSNFNFVDKPHDLCGGAGVRAFDDEGNQTSELEIVKDGILQTFLHNQRTANKENLKSTGNAIRGLGNLASFMQTPDTIMPNSPWIMAGDVSEEEMIQNTRRGIIIHNYQGTCRYENGIFSGVAKGAYLIENGEITQPITGVSIAGNVFDLLNNIKAIGKEYHLANGILKTPIMQFEGIKISTK